MTQIQGSQTTSGGRLDGSVGTALTATDTSLVLGAGWGASTFAIAANSTDQAGTVTITAVTGGGLAQATATVTLTFKDGAFALKPRTVFVWLANSSNAVTETGATATTWSTTSLAWTHSVLPVNTKTYTYNWAVIQ